MPKLLTVWITTNCRILKEMGIPDHLTCLLRNLHAGQEVTVRTRHGTMTCSKLGQEYVKAVYHHPAYLTSVQSTSCIMPDWMKHKVESRLMVEITTNSDIPITSPLWQKAKRNWRASWWRWRRRVKKTGLKLNIQKMKITASSPINSWQIDEEIMRHFILGGLQSHCRWWLQPWN